jgi:hypothetical protein
MTKFNSSYSTTALEVLGLPTYLSLEANKDVVEPGEALTLNGLLTNNPASTIGIGNATVHFARYVSTGTWQGWVRFGSTVTNGAGLFSSDWSFTQGGDYEVRAEYTTGTGELIISDSVFFTVGTTLNTTITASLEDPSIYLGEDFVVVGRLVDPAGNGVPGVNINVNVIDRLPFFTTITDANGNYESHVNSTAAGITAPGSYLIRVSFQGATI